ncbi:RHS repeat domain-containing protein, partial [Capnocytophaga canimorsus]|uniref:RHS repeat domain-containing protein n=1 Tax=Capnocytophaga canimorsus TaxID=28188 RepID=UPI0026F3A0B1
SQQQIKRPDAVGNLFETEMQTDRHYAAGGQLTKDQHWHYHYDEEGNLILKSPFEEKRQGQRNWHLGSWAYEWNANGSLKKVKRPDGKEVTFTYDALGRRTKKVANGKIKRYLWDSNVLLHEWEYNAADEPQLLVSPIGEVTFDKEEPIENLITWVYENGSFVPIGKLTDNESFSIVSDYIGRPVLAFDEKGEKVWSADYDIYGRIRKLQGDKAFIPFRQLGQYEDVEIELYYNRFRYYDCNTGTYISQDPIGLVGGLSFYAYVRDVNRFVDIFGLELINPFSIFYSQNSISSRFKNKNLLDDVIQNIKNNPSIIKDFEAINIIKLEDLPDNIQQKLISQGANSGDIFSLDNRRLYVAKTANVELINANFIDSKSIKIDLNERFSTKDAGRSIKVRCKN